jgi:acyl-coenzyme A thioesterase PaaI-like protein
MRAEILDVDAERGRLVVRFPHQARFRNSVGFMQGGMIASALDNVFGPHGEAKR